MSDIPILFKGEMVRAILEGRKTQTRRVIRNFKKVRDLPASSDGICGPGEEHTAQCPYEPGGRLWVRETWAVGQCADPFPPSCLDAASWHVYYKADGSGPFNAFSPRGKWRPSIHMVRWASRITLEIVSVRVERLQEMHHKADQFTAEGIELPPSELYKDINTASKLEHHFKKLWDSTTEAAFTWEKNPWVWVIEFKKV